MVHSWLLEKTNLSLTTYNYVKFLRARLVKRRNTGIGIPPCAI